LKKYQEKAWLKEETIFWIINKKQSSKAMIIVWTLINLLYWQIINDQFILHAYLLLGLLTSQSLKSAVSVVADFFIELFCALIWRVNHLAEDRFLFFNFGELILETIVFLFLVQHTHFQLPVQSFNQRNCRICYFVIDVGYFCF
jgi:hypothetical protein